MITLALVFITLGVIILLLIFVIPIVFLINWIRFRMIDKNIVKILNEDEKKKKEVLESGKETIVETKRVKRKARKASKGDSGVTEEKSESDARQSSSGSENESQERRGISLPDASDNRKASESIKLHRPADI